ncbi:MAG TPA: UDP-glucose/GDP-mannose dehydrogenase family protein [bacterium]|nr:UDP-glucose/GDP-mannose dehydrogenase family protein [bacterium]
MKLAVIGSGYVGLVAGACFAESGNQVICMDNDQNKIDSLKNGIIPIYEPGLDTLVKRNVESGKLTFSTDMESTVKNSDILFIAVGTPPDEDGSADLRHVIAVAKSIGKYMDRPKIVVDKSTVPVGTAQKVKEAVQSETAIQVDVVSNPEFLKEGAAIDDFMYPDRVIIGTSNPEVAQTMRDLYEPFLRTGNPIVIMDEVSAELTKYAANSMLATKISFMNEIANMCDRVGADVEMVRKGIGSDSRIGYSFIFPGVGYGGSCFPKDVKALIRSADSYDFDMRILKAVEAVNEDQKKILIPKIINYFSSNLKGKTLTIWGLSFKPKTDDMREAPSRVIIDELHGLGARLKGHDPEAMDEARRLKLDEKITLFDDNYEALKDSDGLILVTEWLEYREPDFDRMKAYMNTPVIFDGRNIYRPRKIREMGFTYFSIGRPFS